MEPKDKKPRFSKKTLEKEILRCIEENTGNNIKEGYTGGYINGYHDAMVEVLNIMQVKHNHDYRY